MAYDNEGNYVDERGMGPNPEFAVMPEPQAMTPAPPPTPIMSYEEWLNSQPQPPPVNPDFAVMPPTGVYDPVERPPPPYDTQPKPYQPYDTLPIPKLYDPYDPYDLSRTYNPEQNDKPTVYPYDVGRVPYSGTYPGTYPTYETPPQPYNPYDTQPKQYDPYNPDRNDKPTVYPYDTAPSSVMDIGQILAGLGSAGVKKPETSYVPLPTMAGIGAVPGMNGMPSQLSGMGAALKPETSYVSAPTMAPMAPGMTGAAAGIGSSLESLLRRYYGK